MTLAVFLICLGVVVALLAAYTLWEALRSNHWRQAEAIITHSVLRRFTAYRTGYQVEVEYRYSFRGGTYTGKRISYGSRRFSNYERASDLSAVLATGKRVLIYFDPARPWKSVIYPGVKPELLLSVILGPLVSLVGLYLRK